MLLLSLISQNWLVTALYLYVSVTSINKIYWTKLKIDNINFGEIEELKDSISCHRRGRSTVLERSWRILQSVSDETENQKYVRTHGLNSILFDGYIEIQNIYFAIFYTKCNFIKFKNSSIHFIDRWNCNFSEILFFYWAVKCSFLLNLFPQYYFVYTVSRVKTQNKIT